MELVVSMVETESRSGARGDRLVPLAVRSRVRDAALTRSRWYLVLYLVRLLSRQ